MKNIIKMRATKYRDKKIAGAWIIRNAMILEFVVVIAVEKLTLMFV